MKKLHCKICNIVGISLIFYVVLNIFIQFSRDKRTLKMERQIFDEDVHHSSKDKSKWIILGFSDINYLPVAKMWYKRLSSLGYQNHFLMALDILTYNELIKYNYRCNKIADGIDGRFSDIWRRRLEVPLKYLKKGKNVFISDVDTYWNFYFSLDQLSPKFDAFHAYATTWPRTVWKKWGFTLCGGIAGYRSNKKTMMLLQELLDECVKLQQKCDDQKLLNEKYAFSYNLNWIGDAAYSEVYEYKITVFNKTFISRNRINCDSWISTELSSKKIVAKLYQWKSYIDLCVIKNQEKNGHANKKLK